MLNALGLGYSETKIKPYLKMAVQRIQLSNNKKTTSVKHQKREVSTLLADHKDEKARIKVEHIIRDDFVIEAYEILELLCDLLHERLRQITSSKDEPPVELRETVYSLVWAASNCDISELQDVQKHLVRKYGTEYFKILGTEAAPTVLNARLFHKLSYTPPSKHLVNQYLGTIAEVYKVDWTPPIEGEAVEDGDDLNSVPYSTPSGFSIPMAPGSGLTGAYTPTASPVSTPASTSLLPPTAQLVGGDGNTRKLTPEEQAEYDDFEKHQKPVYAAVPGPPPHMRKPASAPEFDHKQQWREQQPQQGSAGTAAAVEEAVELKPSGASTASVTSAPAATTSEMAQLERTFKNVTAGDETVRLEDIAPKPMANYEKPPTPPPPPSTTAPPPPPTTTTTTTSPPPPATATGGGDPMDAMLARLAALKKGT